MLEGNPDVRDDEILGRQRAFGIKDKLDRVRRPICPGPLLSADVPDCIAAVQPPKPALVWRVFFRQIG